MCQNSGILAETAEHSHDAEQRAQNPQAMAAQRQLQAEERAERGIAQRATAPMLS